MQLHHYVAMLSGAEESLAEGYRTAASGHHADADVALTCAHFATRCDAHVATLEPLRDHHPAPLGPDPERLHPAKLGPARQGPLGLLRDLADLHQLATLVEITWELVEQAANGARDRELIAAASSCRPELTAQLAWLRNRMRVAAPQALLVAD